MIDEMKASALRDESVAVEVRPDGPVAGGLFAGLEPGALSAPLRDVLAGACHEMAGLLGADVVSVYVRERADDVDLLVVKGNVGLASEVVGNLSLRVGDGLIGWVAECMRPISVGAADVDPRFKPVRGIGEEPYPVMIAQPVVRGGRCLGVLAFQRSAAQPFTDGEARMAAVLAGAIGLVLEAAGRGAAGGDVGTEAVCLIGRPLSPGLGMGRVELIPTAESLASREAPRPDGPQIAAAFTRVERDLTRLRGRLASPLDPLVSRALARMELLLSDGRLRERATDQAAAGMAAIARDYARASQTSPTSAGPDPALVERAEGIGDLCVLLQLTATGSRLFQSGRIWIGRRLGPFMAVAAARSAAAVVLEGDGEATDEAAAIARAAGLPLLVGVRGLFAWTHPGDLLVADGDRGIVRINPSSSGLVATRASRRR